MALSGQTVIPVGVNLVSYTHPSPLPGMVSVQKDHASLLLLCILRRSFKATYSYFPKQRYFDIMPLCRHKNMSTYMSGFSGDISADVFCHEQVVMELSSSGLD